MVKCEVVFVSKDNEFSISRVDSTKFSELHPEIVFNYVENNKNSLGTVYNTFVRQHRGKNDIDWMIFCHADMSIDMEHFFNHLTEVSGKYDAFGLVGCAKTDASIRPLNWFNMSKNTPEYRYGCVTHRELNNSLSFFNKDKTVTDHRVTCIDGVCIGISKDVINDSTFSFDEQFAFNMYDTSFSFDIILKHNKRLGVIVEPSLVHTSVGRLISSVNFAIDELKFRHKWGLDIPDDLKQIEQLIRELLN